jgi:hypothetical protein
LISIPYGSWLFLGFEELPLIQIEEENEAKHPVPDSHSSDAAAVSAHVALASPLTPNATKQSSYKAKVMFSGIVSSFVTVFLSGVLTVTLASASRPGVDTLKDKSSPLLSGIEEVYGKSSPVSILFNILSILALFAPCYSFMLYCSEHIQVRFSPRLPSLSPTSSLPPSLPD